MSKMKAEPSINKDNGEMDYLLQRCAVCHESVTADVHLSIRGGSLLTPKIYQIKKDVT